MILIFGAGEYVFAQTSMMNEDFRLAVVKGDADKVIQMIDAGACICDTSTLQLVN